MSSRTWGNIRTTTIDMSDNASFIVAREPLDFTDSGIAGIGNIDITSIGTPALERSILGDTTNAPDSLAVNNRGVLTVRGRADLIGAATVFNEGVVQVDQLTGLAVSAWPVSRVGST